MALRVKALAAANPDDLSLIPRTHSVGGENWFQGSLKLYSDFHVHVYPQPLTESINKDVI